MILALDIALTTGWSYGAGGDISFGSIDFHGRAGDDARVGRYFNTWLRKTIALCKPELIAIERPWFKRGSTNGFLLANMVYEAHRVAEELLIPRVERSNNEVKKFATGDGWASKSEVIEAMRLLGYKVSTDNEADAVALLLLVQSTRKKR